MYLPSLSIVETADGQEALQEINDKRPDMVFMDIRLPGRNGLELTKVIKGSYPEVVVSIFTNYDIPEYRKTATEYGADHFLLKDSLSGIEIADMIKSTLSRKDKTTPLSSYN
jgi:DNA-binding NarL/FixJ family response regulator